MNAALKILLTDVLRICKIFFWLVPTNKHPSPKQTQQTEGGSKKEGKYPYFSSIYYQYVEVNYREKAHS